MGFKTLVIKPFSRGGKHGCKSKVAFFKLQVIYLFSKCLVWRIFYGCWVVNHLLSYKISSQNGLIQCGFHLYSHIHPRYMSLMNRENYTKSMSNNHFYNMSKSHFLTCIILLRELHSRYMPPTNKGNCNKGMTMSRFCNRSKSLLLIHTILLRALLSNQSSFLLLNQTIILSFDFIYPMRTNCTLIWW